MDMKRLILILMFLPGMLWASTSAIAIQTEKNSSMQVFVNGKLLNTNSKSFVRIKSNAGLLRVELKVLNPYDKVWYVIRKDVRAEKGFEFHYKVLFPVNKRPVLEFVKRYPVFNTYFNSSSVYKYPVA
jgi:hypothetical protein